MPSTPPIIATSSDSDISCQATRRASAPSASRIASSCWRASARTRNRLATFAHATSSTSPTVPSRIHSMVPMSPTTSTSSGRTSDPNRASSNIFCVKPWRQREAFGQRRQQALHVGVGLLNRHTGLEPRQALEVEAGGVDGRAIELHRQDHERVRREELEVFRKHADDFLRCVVDHQALADGRRTATERALPIPVRDQDDARALRQVVFLREAPAERGPDAEHRQRAVGDVQRFDLFRLAAAGDRRRAALARDRCPRTIARCREA